MRQAIKRTFTLILFCTAPLLLAQYQTDLPKWAEDVLRRESEFPQPAKDADIWRLLDHTLISVAVNGEVHIQRRVVQKVLTESGTHMASLFQVQGKSKSTDIKRLKGWHRRPSGKVDIRDRADTWSLVEADPNRITQDETTTTTLQNVGPGSVVAFESRETSPSLFSKDIVFVMEAFPIAERIVEINGAGGTITPVHFETWQLDATRQKNRLIVRGTPALRYERLTADTGFYRPYVLIGWHHSQHDTQLKDWTAFGSWYNQTFNSAAGLSGEAKPLADIEVLAETYREQQEALSYRQRYLDPDRGWIPAAGTEVMRRKYGDCKDMVACLSYSAERRQITVLPTLTMIQRDFYPLPNMPVSPYYFNHLIAAVPLEQSLGLPAEVIVDKQRYLLVDPTAKGTPLGHLPADYRDRQVLICRPEGGVWVAVPDAAAEEAEVDIKVIARLDKYLTLGGTLLITSQGNALGLRSSTAPHFSDLIANRIRRGLDLPGSVTMKVITLDRSEPGVVKVTCQVSWPSFLRHDIDGYRLPTNIVSLTLDQLEERAYTRQQAICLPARPTVTWRLSLKTPQPLEPSSNDQTWGDATRAFSWKASGGDMLKLEFSRSGNKRIFGKSDIPAGLAYWETYRANYNRFFHAATLLSKRSDAKDANPSGRP